MWLCYTTSHRTLWTSKSPLFSTFIPFSQMGKCNWRPWISKTCVARLFFLWVFDEQETHKPVLTFEILSRWALKILDFCFPQNQGLLLVRMTKKQSVSTKEINTECGDAVIPTDSKDCLLKFKLDDVCSKGLRISLSFVSGSRMGHRTEEAMV